MDLFANLMLGLEVAMSPSNLVYAFVGCLLGTLIGILPGLGPVATIAMLIPFTYGVDPTGALIMLAGIYYGAAYGGSTTAILVNVPGESSSVVTVLDGYQMARQGRAGVALFAAAIASFVAGCGGALILAALSIPLSELAFKFGPSDYFSLMVLGLIGAVSLGSGSVLKAFGMVVLGLLLSLVGTDVTSGAQRFTLGLVDLWDGFDFIVIAVGFFAIGEIVASLDNLQDRETTTVQVSGLLPTREDIVRMVPSTLRGSAIGYLLGVLPGAGLTIASFLAYSVEKRVSRRGPQLGSGAIEGVASPEAANNAAAQTAFLPTLALGIPGSATMALMLGAMMIHNIQPGPEFIARHPDLFWGLVVSMWIGNAMLLVVNLPLVGLWVKLLKIPYTALYPAILMFCCLGVYSVNNSVFAVYPAAFFGAAGYLLRKLECEAAPLVLGFVLGPMIEEFFRRSLLLSDGSYFIFLTRPISFSLLLIASLLLIMMIIPSIRQKKEEALQEE